MALKISVSKSFYIVFWRVTFLTRERSEILIRKLHITADVKADFHSVKNVARWTFCDRFLLKYKQSSGTNLISKESDRKKSIVRHFALNWNPNIPQFCENSKVSSLVIKYLSLVFPGEGSVLIDRIVTDNQWHSLEWSRKYQKIVLVLDGIDRGESTTAGGERLLNVARNGEIFVNISSPVTASKWSGLRGGGAFYPSTSWKFTKFGPSLFSRFWNPICRTQGRIKLICKEGCRFSTGWYNEGALLSTLLCSLQRYYPIIWDGWICMFAVLLRFTFFIFCL